MADHPTAFHVDLRGMVDLLSHHLYSSPRVYLRELIQNAVDALTARRQLDPDWVGQVTVTPADLAGDGMLHIEDTGIGLDEDAIRQVLATIGSSSKRDDLGFARGDYLGQFGIGLLACFLVADEIEVLTRRVGDERGWRWVGRSDGTYQVTPSPEPLPAPGTRVSLRPRHGSQALLEAATVTTLAGSVAGHLPAELTVHGAAGPVRAAGRPFPWQEGGVCGAARRTEAVSFCRRTLGFDPLDVIDLSDPASGVRGYAYVLPVPGGHRPVTRLYARHMLVGEAVSGLLPEWAFFVRAVVNADHLRLTASREGLHEDDALAEAREQLGGQLRRWLTRLATADPDRARRFLEVHHLGAKAMAVSDPLMREVVTGLLTFDTTEGHLTLPEFADRARAHGPVLHHVDTVEDYRTVAPLARACGLPVLNAGYAYDLDLIRAWLGDHPGLDGRQLRPTDLAGEFAVPTEDEQVRHADLLEQTRQILQRAGVHPLLRRFGPDTVPAVLLADRGARQEQDRLDLLDSGTGGGWDDALAGLVPARPAGPQFVFNVANPTVARLADVRDPATLALVVEALYAQALVAGQHPLRPFDSALLARALPALIERAIDDWIQT